MDLPMQKSLQTEDENEPLSDEQIQALLVEAEQRLLKKFAEDNQREVEEKDHLSLTEKPKAETRVRIPHLKVKRSVKPYVRETNGVASLDESRAVPEQLKKLSETIRVVEQPKATGKSKEKPTAGPDWFDLPKTVLTPELKRDLQLLRMRTVLDPKRHYKKESGKAKPPEYSQVGTIVEGPTEFFSARIAKKDRRKTFVEEAMATEQENGRFKRKYEEIQDAKTSGKKAHYKALQAKRKRSRKYR
ncbi:dTDP-fucopyranose mutase [Emydomyces testavorans]|uniref:dTDP-fucopyranose mutase n=1 Tax=Emydomyces testavorans TaxID=2070801 RepID=A0AAF0IQI2_9EURO|nr:dTDP-fucopyranose mutase [Emydomyces testavorans]